MKPGILLVAYGSGNLRGTKALKRAQEAAELRFGLPVRWAFTSELMRVRLARSRTKSDSVLKALNRMHFEHFTHVAVQTLHIIPGDEYRAVLEDCRAASSGNDFSVVPGLPLLPGPQASLPNGRDDGDSALRQAVSALREHMPPERRPEEHVVLMAHGSRSRADSMYETLRKALAEADGGIHLGRMIFASEQLITDCDAPAVPDGFPMLFDELDKAAPAPGPIWLMPLLSVVGKHTLVDMAGSQPESWKSRLEKQGYSCRVDLRGLADDPNFIGLWLDRLEDALDELLAAPDEASFQNSLPEDGARNLSKQKTKEHAMSASLISEAMELNLSQGSMIRRMFEAGIELKKKYGEEAVCDFSLGNPDLAPPAEAGKAMAELAGRMNEPAILGYMPNGGFTWAREKVAAWLSEQQGTPLTAGNVALGCGAAGIMNAFFHSVLEPGDEILVTAPYFGEYKFYTGNHGGVLKPVPCRKDFGPDIEALAAAVTPKTRAVIINSPNNPSGAVYSKADLDGIAGMLAKASARLGRIIYLVCDEPYRFLAYDGVEVPSAFHAYENSVVISSFAKNYGLAGERVGYIAVNPAMKDAGKLMDAVIFSNRVLGFVNPPVVGQYLMAACLGTSTDQALAIYKNRRDRLAAILKEAGFEYDLPKGTFYFFPKAPEGDDKGIVEVLAKHLVLAVPGSGFGCPGYIRLSFAVDDAVIERSAKGFKAAMEEYRASHRA